MDDNSTDSPNLTNEVRSELGGKIILFSVVTLMGVITLILCFHFYSRLYSRHIIRRTATSSADARHVAVDLPMLFHRGLLPSLIKLIPTFVYSATEHHHGLECSVCLSEFEEGETGRVLPGCRHCFHVECIDVWFKSHSTCPVCRAPVKPTAQEAFVPMGQSVVVGPGQDPMECEGSTSVKSVYFGSESPVLIVAIAHPNPV